MRNHELIDPVGSERARRSLASLDTYRGLAALFGALADPTRARIAHALLSQELCTQDLALVLELSPSAVSQHLRVLRNLRLVRARRQGKLVLCHLDDAHVSQLVGIGLANEGEGPTPPGG